MAIIRSLIPAALALIVAISIPNAVLAKGRCDNPAAQAQIKFQIHQLDQQRRLIERQYRGPGNQVARRNALAQIERQRDGLEAQRRALRAQKERCKEGRERFK
ncbi:MAG: hypothetical protein NVS2B17_26880 [Candidatus Velthaea sp.]